MKFKGIMCAALAAVTAVSMCGCSVKFGTNKQIKDTTVVSQGEGPSAQGKDMKVTYGEFKKEYLYYLKTQGIEDDSAEEYADLCKERRATIINYLINEKIILDKAKELGIGTLSDEEMDAVEEEYNALVAEQVEYFAGLSDGEKETSEELSDADKEKRGNEKFDEYLADCGLTRDDLLMWQVNSALTNKVIEETVKEQGVEYPKRKRSSRKS